MPFAVSRRAQLECDDEMHTMYIVRAYALPYKVVFMFPISPVNHVAFLTTHFPKAKRRRSDTVGSRQPRTSAAMSKGAVRPKRSPVRHTHARDSGAELVCGRHRVDRAGKVAPFGNYLMHRRATVRFGHGVRVLAADFRKQGRRNYAPSTVA